MIKEATFGAGCFWCVEACFKELRGVVDVSPGYAGGVSKNPSYEEVCSGETGHAEVVRIVFDDSLISFDELLEVFWFIHNPRHLNRQGEDVGTQYRSVIFYHDDLQRYLSELYKSKLEKDEVWSEPIVTEVSPLLNFYPAENYHFNYLALNPQNTYCQVVAKPKFEKFKKVFAEKINNC